MPTEFVSTAGRLSGRVYAQVKQRILDGHYKPGDRIPIDELAVEFRSSKQPVREAVRTLAADGLLDIQPQIGTIVAEYSRAEFVMFYRVLAGYEGAAAEAAAQNCRPEDARAIRALLDREVEGAQLRRANREFHTRVHQLANSRLISIQSQRMWDLSDFLLGSLPEMNQVREGAVRQHKDHGAIVDALEAQDSARAGKLMTAHVRAIADLIEASAIA
ncbi:GntR family transcriptional regulator [Nocardia carnea]|uniref:GntR family transcriptional regulator n=1 Tax=Nocardia TaxID=1817 RepID=UPI002455A325|nr:GntR family transcriptional regulator [Nocardia carnea]